MPERRDLYRRLRERYAEIINDPSHTMPAPDRVSDWIDIAFRDLGSQRVAPAPMLFEQFAHQLRRNQPVNGWNLVARNRAHTAPFFTPLYETTMRYPITEYTVARLRGDSANPDTRESLWYIAEDLALMYGYYLYCHTLPSEGGSR
jgi:hypothetical protein